MFGAGQVRDDGLRATLLGPKAEPAQWSRLCTYVEARRAAVLGRMKLNHYRTDIRRVDETVQGVVFNRQSLS